MIAEILIKNRREYCGEWGYFLGIGETHNFGGIVEKVVSEKLCYCQNSRQHYMDRDWVPVNNDSIR